MLQNIGSSGDGSLCSNTVTAVRDAHEAGGQWVLVGGSAAEPSLSSAPQLGTCRAAQFAPPSPQNHSSSPRGGPRCVRPPRGRRGGRGGTSLVITPCPSPSLCVGGAEGGHSLSYQWSCLDGNKICTERHENGVNKRDKNGTIKPATSPPLIKKRERGGRGDALSP